MPTYDYHCPSCGYKDEKFHGILEENEYECPKCHAILKKGPGGGTATLYKVPGFTLYKGRNGQ